MEAKIIVLPGDGIGPEITAVTTKVLDAVAQKFGHSFEFSEELIGGVTNKLVRQAKLPVLMSH